MFRPFYGWLFNPEVVPDVAKVTSPPYDVITEDKHQELIARSEYNIVRLLLPGRDASSYAKAAAALDEWRTKKVLVRDPSPRFYLYESDYLGNDGDLRTAWGIFGALAVVSFGEAVVPHEKTIDDHREDRLALLTATRANLDPIIGLTGAHELPGLVRTAELVPRLAFDDSDGSRHRLFDITDEDTIGQVQAAINAHPIAIADGHHRYTTALRYKERMGAAERRGGPEAIMAMVSPAEGSGLTIDPYHRLLPAIEVDRELIEVDFAVSRVDAGPPSEPGTLVVVTASESFLLRPRPEALNRISPPLREAGAAVANDILYPRLGLDESAARYTASAAEAIGAARGGYEIAILVAPVSESAVAAAGEMGIRFPTKTTHFNPKPRAGLVVRYFDGIG